jgi:hypothetical protein
VHHDPSGRSGNARKLQYAEAPQSKIPRRGHDLRGVLGAYATGILVEGHVADVMKAIFDSPVASVECKQPLGISPLGFEACDAVGHFERVFAFLPAFARDLANLLQVGPVGLQIGGQFGRGDERTAFTSAMPLGDGCGLDASCIAPALLVGGKCLPRRQTRPRCHVAKLVGSL